MKDIKLTVSFDMRAPDWGNAIGQPSAPENIERMEKEGVVGAANHVGKREVLAPGGSFLCKVLQGGTEATLLAAFALENPDEIAFGTVSSIADQAQVQPSALVRFSQAMGYQGFSDMQEVFRSRLRDRILNYGERLEQLRHQDLHLHVGEVQAQAHMGAAAIRHPGEAVAVALRGHSQKLQQRRRQLCDALMPLPPSLRDLIAW